MTGEVISLMAQATPAGARMDDPVLRVPSTEDAERFSDFMGSASRTAPQDGVPMVDAASAARPVNSDSITLGDRIMRSLNATGNAHVEQAHRVDKFLAQSAGGISSVDMLRMQWSMARNSLMVDLVAKTVQKTGQNIDSLTKLQ